MSNFSFDLDGTTDEDFFGALKNPSSKLQKLFADDASQDETEHSLKYKRPKANDLNMTPKAETTAPTSAAGSHPPPAPLMAKVVTAYLQGMLQGKVGLALTTNVVDNLILYKSKNQVLVTLLLEKDFQVLFKQNKYWQFYDDQQQYWSFSFENDTDEDDFRQNVLKMGHKFKENEEQAIDKQEIRDIAGITNSNQDSKEEESKIDLPKIPAKQESKENKNALIQRMARMGQPLPKLSNNPTQTTTEFSDSSDTEVINMPLPAKPVIAPRNKVATLKNNHQICNTFNSSMYPSSAMEAQYMQMLLTEQRTQGSELRINVSKLETKIEKVLDKLDLMDRSTTGGDSKEKRHKDDEILELEEKILNLKKENRKLKQLSEQRNEQESYEQKSKEILLEFQDDLEELNMGNLKNLKAVVSNSLDNIKDTQNKYKDLQRKWQENEDRIRDKQKIIESANAEHEIKLKQLKDQNQKLKDSNDEMGKLVANHEQTIENLKKDFENESKNKQNATDALVKSIMNNLYGDICNKLEATNLENQDVILNIVASCIKQQTLKSLQKS
ncbi:kinesin-like protein KIF20B [Stomoxys calcitrans]|uniref:kinesin-like protein KIF20B n=1 Tax=Stomoxys calcitrans TaxID=35570 RepID=UPI0027E334B4|nr:kinesin-like protein KIF20B [Stomoxys calcitrans]